MSRLPFELLLAFRYLRPKRTFVSVITLISVLGVMLGVAVLIIVISVMTGFDLQLRDKILGFSPHVRVTERDRTMANYQAVLREVASNSAVKAVSPYVLGQVLVKTEPQDGRQPQVGAPWLRGVDPAIEGKANSLPEHIVAGAFDLKDRGVVVGSGLAMNLNLAIGDRVLIYSPDALEKMEKSYRKAGAGNGEGAALPVPDEYEVRGIFDMGHYEYNSAFILASLADAQELYVLDRNVHGLTGVLKDPYQAPAVQAELAQQLGRRYRVTTWMDENSEILSALVVEKNVMFYLLFFIMIVAALCILSALITFVVQKTREIGMLKALGATDWQVAVLFLSQSGFVGVAGVAAGLGLGMLAVAYRNEFLHFMNRMTGFELFPAAIYQFNELPAQIVPRDIIVICSSALVICLLGGVIPAWRAGRLKPVEALRYE